MRSLNHIPLSPNAVCRASLCTENMPESGVKASYRQSSLVRILSSGLVEGFHHRILVSGVDRAGAIALS
jgi:hypothetical protein